MKSTIHVIDRDREYGRDIRLAAAATLAAVIVAFLVLPQPEVKAYSPGLRSLPVEQLFMLDGQVPDPSDHVPLRARLPIPSPDGQAVDSGVGLQNWNHSGPGQLHPPAVDPLPYYKVERKPEVIEQVVPAYPELARAVGIEGRVVVQVVIDSVGMVARADVLSSSGSSLLDAAALEAARGFRFRPGYQLDRPVPVAMAIPFSFRLN